eukprot:2603917-Pleurochrysis_carterae.AAC.3
MLICSHIIIRDATLRKTTALQLVAPVIGPCKASPHRVPIHRGAVLHGPCLHIIAAISVSHLQRQVGHVFAARVLVMEDLDRLPLVTLSSRE